MRWATKAGSAASIFPRQARLKALVGSKNKPPRDSELAAAFFPDANSPNLLHHAKRKRRRRVHGFARAENRARKIRMVRRIGKMLRLQAEPGVLFILHAVPSRESAGQKIAGVELHAWLR